MDHSKDRRRRLDGRKRAKNKDRRRNQAQGTGAHWFNKAENIGIYHYDSKEDDENVMLSGRLEGYKIRLSRPKVVNDALDQPVPWTIELDAPRVCKTLMIQPRAGWSLARNGDGYMTDHEDFDEIIKLEGQSDMLLPILTHRVRLMLMGWIERGGALRACTLSWSFDDEPFASAVLSRCRRLTSIARRLSLHESARRKRCSQIAVYDPIPAVRPRSLKALIAESDTMDKELAQARRRMGARGGRAQRHRSMTFSVYSKTLRMPSHIDPTAKVGSSRDRFRTRQDCCAQSLRRSRQPRPFGAIDRAFQCFFFSGLGSRSGGSCSAHHGTRRC